MRRPQPWELFLPLAGVAVAVLGALFAVRQADASAIAGWRHTLEQERDEHRVRVDAWLDAGRMTARLAAGYPTARYVAEGRSDDPRPFPATEGAVPHLARLLGDLCRESGLDAAFLVSSAGVVLTATAGATAAPGDLEAARRAIAGDGGGVTTLEREGAGAVARFAAPLRAEAAGAPATAAVVLREDAASRMGAALHRRAAVAGVVVESVRVERTPEGLRPISPVGPDGGADDRRRGEVPKGCLTGDDDDLDHTESGTDAAGRELIVTHGKLRGAPWILVCWVPRSDVVARGRGIVLTLGFGVAAATLGLALALLGIRQRRLAEQRVASLATAGRLKDALDRGDDVALFVREDGTITEAHGAVPRVYGLEPAALVGRTLADLVPPARRTTGGAVPATGVRVDEAVHRRADGTEVPVEVSLQRIEGGGPAAAALVRVRDITERRRNDDRLHALNRLLRMRSGLSQALTAAPDRAAVYAATCRIAAEQGGFRLVWIGEPAPDGRVVAAAVAGDARDHVGRMTSRWAGAVDGRGPAGRAIAERRTVVCAEIAADPTCAGWVDAARAAGVRSTVAIPVGVAPEGTAVAALVLHAAEPDAFDAEVLDVVESIAAGVVGALDRIAARASEREANERLRASEAAHRLLFESNPSPMWVFDLETLRILEANEATTAVYGWTREELQQRTLLDVRPAEDVPRFLEFLRRPRQGITPPTEWRHVRKDGTVFPVRILHSDVEFLGRAARLVLIEDLTERRRAEEATRTLIRAVEQSPVSIVVTNRAGVIEYVNPHFCRASGYEAHEALGANPRILKSGRTPPEVYGDFWRTVLAGRTWRGELVNRRKDGTEFTELATIAPVHDASGAITHFVAVKEDLTDRRAMEARATSAEARFLQAQKLEAVGQLAGGVAHDFNNLLCVILGYGQMVATSLGRGHPEAGKIEQVIAAGKRAESLTRQLLAFSRRQVLQPRVVDLHEVVRGFEKMLRRLIGEDVELRTRFGADAPVVLVDPGQLEQVLLNLTVNARDAMPHGGHVTIGTRSVDVVGGLEIGGEVVEPGPWLVLSVEDDGTGMDRATLARIFEPFFTTKPAGQGTGLGLPTVHGIVRQSGGHVAVESTPGKGSSFSVYLPRFAGHVEAAAPPEVDLGAFAGHETVLVVEDQDGVRELVRAWLEGLGYAVIVATDGLDALDVAERLKRPVDLLLTDVVMPRLGGREVAERLLARWPGLQVVYMSGYTSDVIARQGILESGVRLLEKPLSQAALAKMVRQTLDARR
ncbi:MAG: PAS domain S-box protein [Planctomycetia bacterium]|nr:PAS domain S-box protein [Planctomycetia bacterium]